MRLKSVLNVCVGMLLSVGCGAWAAESAAQLAPTHGYVYASLPGAEPGDTLVLQSVADESKHTLPARVDADGNAVGMWLPAGDYKLYRWRGLWMGNYPSVSVKAARLTDLGSLVAVPVGSNDLVLLPVHSSESARNAAVALAEFQPVLVDKEPIQWRMAQTPAPFRIREVSEKAFGLIVDLLSIYESRTNAAPMSKQLREAGEADAFLRLAKFATPPLTQKPVQDAQGRMFFGAALGQVRVREASGAWTAIDTGSLHSVTAVAVRDALMVAGFDNGTLRASDDGGKTWNPVTAWDRSSSVVDITRLDAQWLVTTAHNTILRGGLRSVDQMTVYGGKADDLGDLAKLKDFALETEALFRPHAEAFQGYYYLNAFPKLWRLDVANQQWRAVGPDTDVHGFQVSPVSGTLAAYRIKGGFSRLYVSTDHAQTWTRYDNPPYVIMDIRFANAEQGQAVRWNTGAFSGTVELMQYDRPTDAWTKSVEAPPGCVRVLPDAQHTARLCVTKGGNILSLAGGKWLAEFAVD